MSRTLRNKPSPRVYNCAGECVSTLRNTVVRVRSRCPSRYVTSRVDGADAHIHDDGDRLFINCVRVAIKSRTSRTRCVIDFVFASAIATLQVFLNGSRRTNVCHVFSLVCISSCPLLFSSHNNDATLALSHTRRVIQYSSGRLLCFWRQNGEPVAGERVFKYAAS